MDDIELPPILPSARNAAQTPPRTSLFMSRKRTHADYDDEPSTSSDPALFSSDEQAPGVENYISGRRRKRTFKGSWWERHLLTEGTRKSTRKHEFKRNFDSGIFMGSEGSEETLSSDSFTLEDEFLKDQQKAKEMEQPAQVPRLWASEDNDTTPRAKMTRQTGPTVPDEHMEVIAILQQCLEKGKESVDLSSMSLSTLPLEISSLQTLSKNEEMVPGMLDTGTSLEPQLRLFLSNNLLTKFPTPILDLQNLRELSIRNNQLTSIPPSIRELVNLELLNVSGNHLTELPFEVVELFVRKSLRHIHAHANPWKHEKSPWPHSNPSASDIATAATMYKYQQDCRRERSDEILENPRASFSHQMNTGLKVPSLTELVLRRLSNIDPQNKIDFRSLMPHESPESVLHSLDMLNQMPGRRCTSCRRPIVQAGKEWLEWWRIGSFPLPFRRLQCWHGCQGTESAWVGKFV